MANVGKAFILSYLAARKFYAELGRVNAVQAED